MPRRRTRRHNQTTAATGHTCAASGIPQSGHGSSPTPGLYYLEMRAPNIVYDKDRQPPGYLLSITRSSILLKRSADEVLAWVTDLQSGQPVPDAAVTIRTLATDHPEKGSGITDAEGVARFPIDDLDIWTGFYALVERDGNLEWEIGALGSHLSKHFVSIDLVGKGAEGRVAGLFYTDQDQHLSYNTMQRHLARTEDESA